MTEKELEKIKNLEYKKGFKDGKKSESLYAVDKISDQLGNIKLKLKKHKEKCNIREYEYNMSISCVTEAIRWLSSWQLNNFRY